MGAYRSLILAEASLVAYWPLSEASGTSFADVKGGNNLAMTGATGSNVTLGTAGLRNDPADKSLTIASASAIVLAGADAAGLRFLGLAPYTLEGWALSTGLAATRYLISLGTDISNTMSIRQSSGSSVLAIRTIAGGANTASAPGAPLADGLRHHLAATYDGSRQRMYIDGVLVATSSALAAPMPNAPMIVRVGQAVDNSNRWGGPMQDVAVYNTALSAAAILAHYREGRTTDVALPLTGVGEMVAAGAESLELPDVTQPTRTRGRGSIATSTCGRGSTTTATRGRGSLSTRPRGIASTPTTRTRGARS
jgi:hypothetical protein